MEVSYDRVDFAGIITRVQQRFANLALQMCLICFLCLITAIFGHEKVCRAGKDGFGRGKPYCIPPSHLSDVTVGTMEEGITFQSCSCFGAAGQQKQNGLLISEKSSEISRTEIGEKLRVRKKANTTNCIV